MDVSCHRPFLPGTSLEPAVNPTAQASSFTLLHTAVLSVVCDVPSIVVFCSETIESFPGTASKFIIIIIIIIIGDRGGTVVNVLCYKWEGRWFDSRWCHWNFSFLHFISFQSLYGPEVDTFCNRNEYQEHFLGVKAAGA
jgi:hypothetical protein